MTLKHKQNWACSATYWSWLWGSHINFLSLLSHPQFKWDLLIKQDTVFKKYTVSLDAHFPLERASLHFTGKKKDLRGKGIYSMKQQQTRNENPGLEVEASTSNPGSFSLIFSWNSWSSIQNRVSHLVSAVETANVCASLQLLTSQKGSSTDWALSGTCQKQEPHILLFVPVETEQYLI